MLLKLRINGAEAVVVRCCHIGRGRFGQVNQRGSLLVWQGKSRC